MPHIILKKKELLKTPSNLDGVYFKFIAKSYNLSNKPKKTEYKIVVENENKEFLLTLKSKNDDYLLKFDKPTRVTPISIVKKALNTYIKLNQAEVISSNTNNLDKIEHKKEYLKDITYFVNDFRSEKNLQIEIGFGSGRHLLYQAKLNPHIQFIGLEIHTPSIEQLLRQIELQEIKNILIVNYDARLFMEFIQSNKVEKIFVHFPVPWDKKPHRRVYSNEFINEALRVLKVNGNLELRTDSRKYFEYSLDLLTRLPKGQINININKDLEISSKYEDRWKKQGKHIYDVVLKAFNEDENISLDFNFDFYNKLNLQNIIEKLSTKAIIKENFFVHFEEIYLILNLENSGLLKLTMGSFDRPITKYLFIKDGQASYYQGNPLPTSANIKAHKTLKKILEDD